MGDLIVTVKYWFVITGTTTDRDLRPGRIVSSSTHHTTNTSSKEIVLIVLIVKN